MNTVNTAAARSGTTARFRLGCDIGGTFTDFSLLDMQEKRVYSHKRLTTPDQPSRAIDDGIRHLARQVPGLFESLAIIHGTTLVVNAIIERKGVRTALFTTEGFRDVLEIGREGRFDQYDLWQRFPAPIIPRKRRYEVAERLHYSGKVIRELDERKLAADLQKAILEDGIDAVAVCLLHAYHNPKHENRIREIIAQIDPTICVSLSHEVSAEAGEYERTCTTALNAYTQPIASTYLLDLERRLAAAGFKDDILITLSTGGVTSVDTARRFPVRIMESGPAGGVISAAHYGKLLGIDKIIAFDMGGTTAKIALVKDGKVESTNEFEVDRTYRFKRGSGLPVRVPIVDLMEIGAGGGSIARVSDAGTLQVGPESVGADPGPACYDQGGTEPSVTDANLVLGYLDAGYFLGGEMALKKDLADKAIGKLSRQLGIDIVQAADGIHTVVNENMAAAGKIFLAEKGVDPSQGVLFVSGGCGPVHAVDLMRRIGVRQALIPPRAGVGSAFGMSIAPVSYDIGKSYRRLLSALDVVELDHELELIEAEARARLPKFVPQSEVRIHATLDMRYLGQGFNVAVPYQSAADVGEILKLEFEKIYGKLYGRVQHGTAIEIMRASLHIFYEDSTIQGAFLSPTAKAAPGGKRRLAFRQDTKTFHEFAVYRREDLPAGFAATGPLLIEDENSTIVVPTPDTVEVLDNECVRIVRRGG